MLVQINTKIEKDVKTQVEEILSDLGLTISDAMRIFLKKIIDFDGIPFKLKRKRNEDTFDDLTEETKKCIEETNVNLDNLPAYKNVKELFDSMGITNY